MTYEVSATDRWVWQRRAHLVLGQILHLGRPRPVGRGLPAIAWTIGDVGALVMGRADSTRIDGVSPLEAFEAWREALRLQEFRDHHDQSLGQRRLTAWTRRFDGLVQVTVVAEIWDDEEPEGQS
ncbi:hypothetical protein ABN028_34025 [Actinopolymorpha sp. B17G11]|uniref:hypothetical protein n=1 Tax=Actinopolymorpha sp. B17G11 TaxID=3160861 RepID=UPI0032E50D00